MKQAKPQPMDLNVMHPTAEQRIPSAAVDMLPPRATRALPESAQIFGSLVRGFAGGATKLLDR